MFASLAEFIASNARIREREEKVIKEVLRRLRIKQLQTQLDIIEKNQKKKERQKTHIQTR